MNYQHLQVALFLSAAVVSLPAAPQVAYERATYKLTAEGYANFTGAYVAVGDEPRDTTNTAGRIDAEARLLGLAMTSHGFALGPRVTLRGSTTDTIDVGEYSLIGIGRWGRVEFGRRRGLPDILTGYGPNAYQFVSAEFGPASGPSLDPDGGLQTSLLTQGLRDQINHLTSLGITASLFFDESPKIIYVAPKTHGFLGGISFSPNADNAAGDYAEVVQTGLVYEKYWQQNVVRIGGTYAYADGAARAKSATVTDDLHSLSGGVALTWHDDLTLAASFTYNGNTGLQHRPGIAAGAADAYGYAFSANYNRGPWSVGGFYQAAKSEGDSAFRGRDALQALEFGGSYRFNTQVRLFSALYFYDFDEGGGQVPADRQDGVVLLLGLRLAL